MCAKSAKTRGGLDHMCVCMLEKVWLCTVKSHFYVKHYSTYMFIYKSKVQLPLQECIIIYLYCHCRNNT